MIMKNNLRSYDFKPHNTIDNHHKDVTDEIIMEKEKTTHIHLYIYIYIFIYRSIYQTH